MITDLISRLPGGLVIAKFIKRTAGVGLDTRRFGRIVYSVGQVSTQACAYMLEKRITTLSSALRGRKKRIVNKQKDFGKLRPMYSSPMNPSSMRIGDHAVELSTIPYYSPSYDYRK